MMKYIIILLLVLTSCGSRKVIVDKAEKVESIDSIVTQKIDGTFVKENNVFIKEDTEELQISPIDSTKPLVIDNKRYFNALIRIKKTNKALVDTSKIKVSKTSLIKTAVKKDTKTKALNKTVDKKANYFIYLWLLLIPFSIYVYRTVKSRIFL